MLHSCFLPIIVLIVLITQSQAAANGKTSTIDEPDDVDPAEDVENLKNAMKGWGTNEQTIIDILTHRSYNNRLKIGTLYQATYSDSLWEDIKSETSGDFRTALKALVLTEARFFAEEMRNAMRGWGTNEDTLLLCLMLTVNDHLTVQGMKDYYQSIYDRNLQDDIEDETGTPFKEFLVEVLNRPKFNESAELDEIAVTADLSDIQEFIEDKKVLDIVYLVTTRSLSHLAMLQEKYYQSEGIELIETLDEISDHHVRDGLISFMSVATDFYRYCADELHNAMDGHGTEEGVLTRIIATRADKDLATIKDMYFEMFGETLSKAVQDDTSGDYEKTLISLIN
ncbi:hypothetical protein ACHWQZ_G003377 [Mnemiopsis leidyi]